METLVINGKRALFGSARIPGAKNSALPVMAAAMLCRGTVVLQDVPRLSDVACSLQILQSLGCRARYSAGTVTINAGGALTSYIPPHLMGAMRSSIFFLAPMLARTGRAEICMPGGCPLGTRPIDIHLDGLAHMGVTVYEKETSITLTAQHGLTGADFTLRFPSVGATETLMMAAATAKGCTVLRGVAVEPEITDLAHFLMRAGAKIAGAGTRTLRIMGQESLSGAIHPICPDRITASTVLCAVGGCGGEVLLTNCNKMHMMPIITALRRAGCSFSTTGSSTLAMASPGALRGIGRIATGVFPAFSTDAAPLLAAAMLRAKGKSEIEDTIFENRFACADGFMALGAQVKRSGRSVMVSGTPCLQGGALCAVDLRGGAALVIAALMAEGQSTLTGVEYIARGYEDIAGMFAALGADIALRCTDEEVR